MTRRMTRLRGALLLAGVLLGVPAAAWGQFVYSPGNAWQFQRTQAALAASQAGWIGYNPYFAGYAFPPTYYIPSATGDILRGAASAMDASSRNLTATQDARIRREQWQQARLETRRKMLDEYYYEQSLIPPLSQRLEDERQERVRQARNLAPMTEIISGSALNELLKDIQKVQSQRGLTGTFVPLETELLSRISLTGVASAGGNNNFFPADGRLQWPLALQDDRFEAKTKEIDGTVAELVKQAQGGQVQGKTYKKLRTQLDALRGEVRVAIEDMTPTENVQARRFVDQLTQAAKTFEDPNVANFFNGKWSAQGNSIGELVDFMTKNGLRFAPAAPGNEQFYNALYQGIVQYHTGLTQLASAYPR